MSLKMSHPFHIVTMSQRSRPPSPIGGLFHPERGKSQIGCKNRRPCLPCWGGCPSYGWGASEGTPCRSRRPGGGGWHRPVPHYLHPPLAVCWLPWLPLHLSPHMERLVAWKTSWKKKKREIERQREREGKTVSNIQRWYNRLTRVIWWWRQKVWPLPWIKLLPVNYRMAWHHVKFYPLCCVFNVKKLGWRHLTVLPAGIHQIPFSSSTCTNPPLFPFLWIFIPHFFISAAHSARSVDRALAAQLHTISLGVWAPSSLADLQTHSQDLQYVYHGGHSAFTFSKRRGHYCKWSPLALALWRKWPCLDNRLSERDT